jgi:hypothetical protein
MIDGDLTLDDDELESLEGDADLSTVFDRAMRTAATNIHCVTPGKVSAVDGANGTSTLTPSISRPDADDEPEVPLAPIAQIRSATAWIMVPVAAGDRVIAIHADRSADEWIASGGSQRVDAQDPRSHDITDAIVLPIAIGANARPNDLHMGCGNGQIVITSAGLAAIISSAVRLGTETAIHAAARGDIFNSDLATLLNAMSGALATLYPTIATAVTAFNDSASARLSSSVQVD